MSSLRQPRRIRVLADWGGDGFWTSDGPGFPHELPVSDALLERLARWQAWYIRDEEKWDERKGRLNQLRFSAEGRRIARAIKSELPDWTVLFFDDAALRSGRPQARAMFEYEIR